MFWVKSSPGSLHNGVTWVWVFFFVGKRAFLTILFLAESQLFMSHVNFNSIVRTRLLSSDFRTNARVGRFSERQEDPAMTSLICLGGMCAKSLTKPYCDDTTSNAPD